MNPVSVIIGLLFIGVQTWVALSRLKGLSLVGKVFLQIGLAIGWSLFAYAMTAYTDKILMQVLISMVSGAIVEVAGSTVNFFVVFQEDRKDAALPAASLSFEAPE